MRRIVSATALFSSTAVNATPFEVREPDFKFAAVVLIIGCGISLAFRYKLFDKRREPPKKD